MKILNPGLLLFQLQNGIKKKNCFSISQEPVRNTTKSYLLFVPINPVDVEIFHRIRKMFGLLVELGEK